MLFWYLLLADEIDRLALLMDREKDSNSLEQRPADRRLIESLYAHGKITGEARSYALSLLYPQRQWGIWTARLLVIIGTALVLSGLIYFFAFNWTKISPAVKLATLQFSMIGCLGAAYFYSLKRATGQIFLLSATVLVGVFLAVFGQIYQTGADAYQLFMTWSLLTFGWTLISNFVAQWMLWLVVTNTFLILWWQQAALPTREMEFMISTYLIVFNGAVLALREYVLVKKSHLWLNAYWIRRLLNLALLSLTLVPILVWILDYGDVTLSIKISATVGFLGQVSLYVLYRYRLPDLWSLAGVVLSGCIIGVATAKKLFFLELSTRGWWIGFYLIMILITLLLFTTAVIYLRTTAKKLKANNV